MGDCRLESVREIWRGPAFQAFRRAMLEGIEHVCETCVNCNIIKYRLFPEDALNDAAERLKPSYQPPPSDKTS